ncbi:pyridoxamine 5'-phosphate oxidase [Prescottella equi]|uniref:pyridoxamine 5'-phosphate oxidase n=1 Tax=Rhodococcus hoagii TaxID=43767 RepID=UPI000D0E586D|nr:pyridoxamine 5'-phosphate oxidase [Prescottella equi]MBU4617457.1 pyridoxamine 5'-phosphate oxidase [Rhodococcus sp. GG48]AVP67506.1 pyridoxamine 5'-phosphate oxidase [Prescottella equi]NKS30495.1 pyridoxamine 5'-phosphate oxidase [Prescottella equi]BCN52775.1 pyridoxine/pyridoxamine 5'-phosphate oxidase [Prescottella equi]BCN82419.1 pyridoxine/pyridoxamine 5'-phosphate oxidase [Prescottella equi]
MRVSYGEIGPQRPVVEPDLEPSWLDDGWVALARRWVEEAVEAGLPEPNAMVLGTVDADGHPCTRTVLCKGFDEDGVQFFTNYDSDKGRQLAATPYASVTFAWIPLAHQLTVRGPVVKTSESTTSEYWNSRPRGSRLGAWASDQSRPIDTRADLESRLVDAGRRFGVDGDIPVPAHWGGFRIRPESVEFWQGRPNRMHNRIRTRLVDGAWTVERLQP